MTRKIVVSKRLIATTVANLAILQLYADHQRNQQIPEYTRLAVQIETVGSTGHK